MCPAIYVTWKHSRPETRNEESRGRFLDSFMSDSGSGGRYDLQRAEHRLLGMFPSSVPDRVCAGQCSHHTNYCISSSPPAIWPYRIAEDDFSFSMNWLSPVASYCTVSSPILSYHILSSSRHYQHQLGRLLGFASPFAVPRYFSFVHLRLFLPALSDMFASPMSPTR